MTTLTGFDKICHQNDDTVHVVASAISLWVGVGWEGGWVVAWRTFLHILAHYDKPIRDSTAHRIKC